MSEDADFALTSLRAPRMVIATGSLKGWMPVTAAGGMAASARARRAGTRARGWDQGCAGQRPLRAIAERRAAANRKCLPRPQCGGARVLRFFRAALSALRPSWAARRAGLGLARTAAAGLLGPT